MASSNKHINTFELALLISKASSNPDALSKILDLGKLNRSINQFFATEATNAGSTGSDPNAVTRS